MVRMTEHADRNAPVTSDHRRQWRRCLYVYPVIARRSKGLSIGVNLNPDKRCNFSCLYCQINRGIRRDLTDVDVEILRDELRLALAEALAGRLWSERRFVSTPLAMRRINDIAFSGDGEPTCLGHFDRAVAAAADARKEFNQDRLKLVVITNASNLRAPQVAGALGILAANNGEIWAKLDAGTEEYFRRINRPRGDFTLAALLDNIKFAARTQPVVIQSLFFRIGGAGPSPAELRAYTRRLGEILDSGGRIKLVQVHTIARAPADASASALADGQLDAIADHIRMSLPDVPVETYYGADVAPQQEP